MMAIIINHIRGDGREYFQVVNNGQYVDSFYYEFQARKLVEDLYRQQGADEFNKHSRLQIKQRQELPC